MTESLVNVLIIAVFADGKIDTEEAVLLQNFFSHYPNFSDVSRDSFQQAQVKLRNRLRSGENINQLIEEIGNSLDEKQRNTAFALAYKICASNFEVDQQETELLKNMKKIWKIKQSIVNAVTLSVELRYVN